MVALLPTRPAWRHPSPTTRPTSIVTSAQLLAFLLPLISTVSAQSVATTIPTRWGQASALVGNLFVVQGGKTQGTTGGGYTYNSAPSDAQMYTLDLSTSFSLASPPWQAITVNASSIAAPAVAFHTISPLNSTALLLFGGDGSPVVPVQTRNDSAYIVSLGGTTSNRTVSYQTAPTTWNQPMRRMYHSSESNGRGTVWIVGGEKADGSGIVLDQQWNADTTASSPTFQLATSSPPGSLVGATSTLLSDGTLLMLGGVDSTGQLQSLQNVYAYSTTSKAWTQTTTQVASSSTNTTSGQVARAPIFPAPRRDHVAVSLPNQRVFIQGGASDDLSTVYSDAWILDWSVNPPMWTLLDTTGGPGPRYGHSAVAYGREVLISFGWGGGNAAPTGLHVFDATSLTASSSSKGSWSGGSWSSATYTPDPQVIQTQPVSSSSGSSSSGSSSSNGSSSSSGGTATISSDPGSGDDGGSADSGSFPTGSTPPSDGGNANSSSSSGNGDGGGGGGGGAKAGAAVGAIIGAGLVVGAGYTAYRRRSLNNYRRYGNASAGILGFGGRRGDEGADDDYLMEKGFMHSDYDRPYHRTDGGAELTGGGAYGRKRGRSEGSPYTARNTGHAMEGSGPHFRERIAILAGRGKRDTLIAPRVDMLADETDGNSLFRPLGAERASHLYDNDDEEDTDRQLYDAPHVREHSCAHVGEEDLSSGDIGYLQQEEDDPEHQMYSPFEDRPEDSRAGRMAFALAAGAHGYGQLADRQIDGYEDDACSHDGRSDFDTHEGPSSGPSLQSHSTTSKSDAPSSSQSYDVLSSAGMVSFSDASHSRKTMSNMMKRSPTWWDRFMGNTVERSAPGRFFTGPNANLPIRDPAPPPVSGLQAITESPRSREVSETQDPFGDSSATNMQAHTAGMDEMGRRVASDAGSQYSSYQHGKTVSSVGSARTGASSHFESRVRGMDVIQRVRTGSSRRTQSTRAGSTMSDTDSEPALSRGPTLLRPRNMTSTEALESAAAAAEDRPSDTPGSVVWKPEDWTQGETQPSGRRFGEPSTGGLEDLAEEGADGEDHSSTSLGADLVPPSRSKKAFRNSNVSETPSITPLTTKRARLNPVMVSPLFPSATPRLSAAQPTPVASGSVKDRVKAIEDQTLPSLSTTVESAWTASMSSAKSARTLSATTQDTSATAQEAIERATSPTTTNTTSVAGSHGKKSKKYYSHGLVPKAQLFVANPDHHKKRSSGSS